MESLNKSLTPVTELMTFHPFTLNLLDTLDYARQAFYQLKIRHLPVVDGDELIGILSLTDILRLGFSENFGASEYQADSVIFQMLSIDQVMKHKPITVSPYHSLTQVAEILSKQEFHALPVVDKNKLVGIVTTTDVICYLLNH